MTTSHYLFVFVFMVALLTEARSRSDHRSHRKDEFNVPCENVDCSGNGRCRMKSETPILTTCDCCEGFTGNHCEKLLSYRCYLRPNATHEDGQILGVKGCPVGQFCLPTNFYCYFYGCSNSIGYCMKREGSPLEKGCEIRQKDPEGQYRLPQDT